MESTRTIWSTPTCPVRWRVLRSRMWIQIRVRTVMTSRTREGIRTTVRGTSSSSSSRSRATSRSTRSSTVSRGSCLRSRSRRPATRSGREAPRRPPPPHPPRPQRLSLPSRTPSGKASNSLQNQCCCRYF